jgi:hypothetical protein
MSYPNLVERPDVLRMELNASDKVDRYDRNLQTRSTMESVLQDQWGSHCLVAMSQ